MKSPRISVLVPVYNREHLVGPCIQSALDQTVKDLEVVVVDNASTDGTWEVCQAFAAHDSRVRIFRNETNLGPVRNWQRCLDEARGEYGKLLFSDDLLMPDFLEKTLPFLMDPGVGFVFTAAQIGPEPGPNNPVDYAWLERPTVVESRTFLVDSLLGRGFVDADIPLSPGAALFRLADLRSHLRLQIPSPTIHDFPDHGAGPDLLLYLLTAWQYPRIAHVLEPLTFFRAHPSSITVQGKGGYIERRYHQAKIWFAHAHPDGEVLGRLLSRVWTLQLLAERSWFSPQRVVREFLHEPLVVRWQDTAWFWGLSLAQLGPIVWRKLRQRGGLGRIVARLRHSTAL